MYRCENKDIWRAFRQHHYLSAELNRASKIYTVYWDEVLVAMSAYLPFPSGVIKWGWRNHRLVVLPDYQNLGIGTKVLEFIGNKFIEQGKKYFERSSHLRLHSYMEHSPLWKATSQNGKVSIGGGTPAWTYDNKRICYSYEYLGEDYATKPEKKIFCEYSDDFDIEKFERDVKNLKKDFFLVVVTGDIHSKTPIEEVCLRNGVRTELLYSTKNGNKTILKKYANENIIRKW